MTAKKKIAKTAEQVAMEDALEVVLERADWVDHRITAYLEEEYQIDEMVNEWCEESLEEHMTSWLDNKYDDEGPDGEVFKKVVQDACRHAVKEFMTEAIMLELLDEVRANMGKLLGRAVNDYMTSINKGESK
jgi:hypothetical protein